MRQFGEDHGYASLLIAALLGTVLSLLSTGYLFATGNNLFHLGIIGALYDLPQYQNDAFIQSLRHYASGPWLILSGKDRTLTVDGLFFVLLFFSRFLSILGFLLCAALLGLVSWRERLVFASVIATCSIMRGLSLAGGGGLFIPEFTQSEIANGLTLIMLYCLGRRNLLGGIILNALVFFTNAFFAVWNALPFLLVTGYWLRTGAVSPRQAMRQIALASLPAMVIAAPILVNIRSNPHCGQPMAVDYLTFLTQYWPLHFLIWSNSLGAIFGLAVIVILGAWGLCLLRPVNPTITLSSLAFVLVYGLGILVPMATHNPAILNLHLLRSSTCLHIMTSLILASLLTRWVLSGDRLERRVLGPLLLLAFCSIRALVPLAGIPLAIAMSPRLQRVARHGIERRGIHAKWLAVAVGVLMLGLWSLYGRQQIATLRLSHQQVRTWTAIGEWARSQTPRDAVFLLPTKDIRPHAPAPYSYAGDSAIFEFTSHRQVWVDFIRGAAVMWTPSYYSEWNSRIWPVLALKTPGQRMDYARRKGITYLVEACTGGSAAFGVDGLCVYATKVPGKPPPSL
ncbi:hypothetical protein ACELLULO517_18265 [Acidisoma cellulosilytica]|uniref:DUF6798 domain-containing protein n=1 Tax=Acidisoma cellulosilyticum TaxID=2802395 RepID=A0A964E5A1_9PROT|nr:DUF6798 domain-containing protein [Acidisoma cellulosilyticum]MCB8882197.1 hypothetical protein [Acidisoma cellulosilyticum]